MLYENIETGEIVEFDGPRATFDVSTSWKRVEERPEPPEPPASVDELLPVLEDAKTRASEAEARAERAEAELDEVRQLAAKAEARATEAEAALARADAEAGQAPAETPGPEPEESEDLSKLGRGALNERAASLGVENPDQLPNKGAVIEAIEKAQAATEQ